ncbi:hypothetical protein WKW77_14155 [Variovorax ureilyticus]|uniref:Uncharacterized protein n=1 Tax=Variovorax ureilyticus TaxID=1836198 RepID=A0ABU8VGD8_9BURK
MRLVIAMAVLVCPQVEAIASKRIKPRTVIAVQISEAGKSEDEGAWETRECEAFRPTKDEVKRFFLKAYPVPEKMGLHDRYSPCYAKGSIEFSDNTRGRWKIRSSGIGVLVFDTGDRVNMFYRDYRWKDPFACSYGLSDEGEC